MSVGNAVSGNIIPLLSLRDNSERVSGTSMKYATTYVDMYNEHFSY